MSRVALVSSSYHPHPGGVEEHVRHVARELVALGHDVRVWTVDRGEHLGTRTVDGIEVRYLPAPLPARSAGALARFALALPWAAAAWARAFLAFRPSVLHVQCFGPNGVYAVVLAALTRVPLLVTSHGETFADDHAVFDRSALLRRALRAAVHRAAGVTACSEFVAADLRDRFGATAVTIVPNGVDLGVTPSPSVARDGHTVFAVGRLERMKGFDLLVDALAHPDVADDTMLVIGGDGSQRASLAKQAADLGLGERVSLPGRLSGEEVADAMARAALVVVPSRREAFGIVVLEAWRAGAPVVVTSRGGPADLVVDGDDGVVVDPQDVGALAAAIGRLLRDRDMAGHLARAGTDRVRQFTWSSVATAYEELYREAGVA